MRVFFIQDFKTILLVKLSNEESLINVSLFPINTDTPSTDNTSCTDSRHRSLHHPDKLRLVPCCTSCAGTPDAFKPFPLSKS